MMTPKNIKAKTAIEYFKKGYYEKGQWLGQGAEKLGLKGEISDYLVYENIVNGLSPDGKQHLNKREVHEDKRKAAVDCTFEAPKSLSITALIGGDERLIEAHNQAVQEVLQLMEERYAKTRIVLDGKVQEVIRTGNMVIAKHDHFESRELDPHIHSHCLVMNITQAPNGEWYSHLNDDIFRYQKVMGMMYQHRLAAKVEKIGYEAEWKENGQFEIKGYPEEHLMAMSKRRQQILEVAGAGASWLERERAWKKTRRNKEYVPLDELQVGWREKAKEIGIEIVKPREPKLEPAQELEFAQASQKNLQKVFDDAIKHCSERRVAFKAEDIERFILSHSRHTIDVEAFQPLIDSSDELIHLQEKDGVRYTTQTAVLRELATIELMKQGQGVVSAIAHPEVVEHHLEQIKLSQDRELNQGQRQAVLMALGATDQFIAWQGVAGAGKTYALNEVKALAEERGYVVKGFAPSAKAARVLSLDLNASTQTVARLLASKLPKKMQPNQIWVVDESGLMSALDVYRLLERAKKEQARVILVGDTKQLSAIEAGAPFKLLQQAGIKTAHLNESQRQKDSPKLKLAVDALAEGRIEDGFNLLVANGCVQKVTKETKVDEIVAAYTNLTPEEQASTLLLAGTHIERQKITEALRLALKAQGRLGENVTLTQLKAKELSDVEKQGYISQFAIGDMVMPLRDYKRKGLTKNELYEVIGKTKDHLQLLGADGTQLEVGLDFKKAIFSKEEIQIAVGDRLMWKKNNQARKQVNGEEVIVRGINGSQVEIEERDGKTQTIDLAQPHHLDYAIVRTTYSSQGETANRVLIAADSTIGKESFYVAASRARLHLCFYTEDSSALLEWAKQSKVQENSLELLRQQIKEQMAAEVLVEAVQAKSSQSSSRATEKPQMKGKTSSPTSRVATPSQVAPPIKRTAENPERVKVSNQPSEQPPVKRSEKQTDMAALMKSDAIKPKRMVPVEAFWTPGSAGVAPFNIELAHWKELVEGSAIHPELAQLNIQSVAEYAVYDRLLSTRLEKIGGSGQYVTKPAANLMQAYEQVAEGGWWAKAGIDARSLPSLQPGERPDLKLWGSFKADNPRVDAEKSHTKGKTEYIKYEHPLGEERQLFLFDVPNEIAERIYNKHDIQPTDLEKQSGFWHIVHKYNLPITVTEGAKKTLSSLSQGEITIGLSGVNGGYFSRDQDKNLLEQRVLHPELQVFATPGREFRFAFDHDTKLSTIFNVRRELVRTGELLEQFGCSVRVVQWQKDKGLDDLIVNQGPLAYTQAQANTIPLASDAKKHYRAEYTRLSKQVRDEQPALTGEAVDVEVYKLAVLKGDIRDGARTIAQSNRVRTFQTELPLQEARAAKLAFIQRIEQQLYQPKIGETCFDELTSQQQVSPVTIQLSDSLAEIAQEMALAITEASGEQEVEALVATTAALVQHLAQNQRDVSPIEALVDAIEEQSALEAAPTLTVALQALSQSLNRLHEAQPLKPLAALNEQSQSFNNSQQPEQSHELTDQSIRTPNSRQLLGLDVRGDQTLDRAHQEPGADATRPDRSPHAIARELSQAISRTTEQQEAEQIAGAIAALNHSYSKHDFSTTGTEALRGAVERYHATVTANFRQQTTRQLVEAVADYIQQSTVVESVAIAQAIGSLTEQLTQQSSKESAQAVAQLNTALSSYLLIVEAMHASYLNQQVVEQSLNAIESYVQEATIDSAPIAQALGNLTVQLNQVQSLDNKAVQHQLQADTTIRAIDQINTAIADRLEQIEPLSIIPDSKLQGTEQLLNAMANYLEGATLNSEPFVQAVQSVSAQLTQLQNLKTSGAIQGLNKAISKYLQQIEQSSAVPVVDKQTTQNLIDAIAEYIEQETIDVSPVSSALGELSGYMNQLQTNKTTKAVEEFNTAISNYRQLTQNSVDSTTDREQTNRQVLEAVTDHIEQAAVEPESMARAMRFLNEQLKQLPRVENIRTVEQLNKVVFDYLQQMKAATVDLHQQATTQIVKAISDYTEHSSVDSEQIVQADAPQPPIDNGRSWVRVKTDRSQLSKFNNQIGVVCGRIRVAGSEEVIVRIGKYTPGFDPSELKPVSSVPKLEGQQGNEQLLQEVAEVEVVNQLNDRDFMLLQQSVVDYFNASPPRPPSVAEQQLVQHKIDKLVKQIDSLWSKQAEQVKLVELMKKNPFHLWNEKYDKAFAQLEKTMSLISQSITQKDQKESKIKEWEKQGEAHQNWENNPHTIEMRKIAEIFKLQKMQERSANIQQAIQQERMRQTSLGRTQQQNQEQGQRRGRGR